MTNTALMTVTEENLPSLLENELLSEVMEQIDFQPGRIKIMHKEKQFFTPDGTAAKKIEGVVIYFHKARGYWADESEPIPTCSSMEGKRGMTNTGEGKPCATCPMNQFGSDPKGGKGKACKEMRRLFILQKGDMYPSIMNVPPTSLRQWDAYVSALLSKKQIPLSFITVFNLEKANNGSFDYCKLAPEKGDELEKKEILGLLKMREEVIRAAEKIGIETEDYVEVGNTDFVSGATEVHFTEDEVPY